MEEFKKLLTKIDMMQSTLEQIKEYEADTHALMYSVAEIARKFDCDYFENEKVLPETECEISKECDGCDPECDFKFGCSGCAIKGTKPFFDSDDDDDDFSYDVVAVGMDDNEDDDEEDECEGFCADLKIESLDDAKEVFGLMKEVLKMTKELNPKKVKVKKHKSSK